MDSSTLPLTDSPTIMQSAKPPSSPTNRSEYDENSDSSSTVSTTPIQFADLPDDILYEIASHLPRTEPATTEALWDRVKPRKQRKVYRPPRSAPRDSDWNRSILALASVNTRFREVLFPGWLVRSKTLDPTGGHGALCRGLSEILCYHVITLVISTGFGGLEDGNVDLCNDILALFPNMDELLIDLSPLNAYWDEGECRLEDLDKAVQQSSIRSGPSSLPAAFPPISTLRISGLQEREEGNEIGLEIGFLQLLLSRLYLTSLKRLEVELVSPVSLSWPSMIQPQSQFSITSLQEFEVECHGSVQGATSLDLCSVVERISHAFCAPTSTRNVQKINIRIIVDLPTELGGTSLWLEEDSDYVPLDDDPVLIPGALPTHEQLLALLRRQREGLPCLAHFAVDVGLRVTDCYQDDRQVFSFWNFCFPASQGGHEPPVAAGAGRVQENRGFEVSREGVRGAAVYRSLCLMRAQELADESELWRRGFGTLR